MADLRKQRRTSRLSVGISFVFHAIIIGALVFLAAREGILGKQLKRIAVTMAPKEKQEKPKEKPPEPKPEVAAPKPEAPKPVETIPEIAKPTAPPAGTGSTVSPGAAPAPAVTPAFDFGGGKTVETASDPTLIYKGFVEYTLRAGWNRPEGIADENYVAEVEVAIDFEGRIVRAKWKRGSGDSAWDNSVKQALAQTPRIGRPPPKGFPNEVLVRFDVQTATEMGIE